MDFDQTVNHLVSLANRGHHPTDRRSLASFLDAAANVAWQIQEQAMPDETLSEGKAKLESTQYLIIQWVGALSRVITIEEQVMTRYLAVFDSPTQQPAATYDEAGVEDLLESAGATSITVIRHARGLSVYFEVADLNFADVQFAMTVLFEPGLGPTELRQLRTV
jgi:hypothetical protein